MTIILIPCLKFLINLIIVCATINISFFILVFAYNVFVGFLFWFLFGTNDKTLDNNENKKNEN